jgi:hypothetical protein
MKTEKEASVTNEDFNFDENIANEPEFRAQAGNEDEASIDWTNFVKTTGNEIEPPTSEDLSRLGDENPNQ